MTQPACEHWQCLFHIKRRYTYRIATEPIEFVAAGSARLPVVTEWETREAWACTMCDWATSDHVVHDLRRGMGDDSGTPWAAEYVCCTGCALLVVMPDYMPDYSGVARMWDRR